MISFEEKEIPGKNRQGRLKKEKKKERKERRQGERDGGRKASFFFTDKYSRYKIFVLCIFI